MSRSSHGMASSAREDEREQLRDAPGFTLRLEWPKSSCRFFLGACDATFSLYDGDDAAFHFDVEGRLRRAFVVGVKFLRGIDGRVVRRVPSRRRGPSVPDPSPFDARQVSGLIDRMNSAVLAALSTLDEEQPADGTGADRKPAGRARQLLSNAAGFTAERRAGERARFLEVYDPLGVLPADRYRNVILQATTGCRYSRCAFCSIYRNSPFRRKTVAEFRKHVVQVRALFGGALALKSGVFLGEANALEIETTDLESMIAVVREELPEVLDAGASTRRDIAAFTDAFEGSRRPVSELRRLAARGLRRVFVGVESGDEVTLRALRKPATCRTVTRRVRDLKDSGLTVGGIFLAGAGGRERTKEHVERSLELVERMGLDANDLIYVSRLEPSQGIGFLDPFSMLSSLEVADEEQRLLTGLRERGLRASRYDLRGFVYS